MTTLRNPPRVAVIGAGMAGLTAANLLASAGLSPVVLEKSRGLGGRMATRRADGFTLDHGAQYVTARGAAFAGLVQRAVACGDAAEWGPGGTHGPRYVGTPQMNALVRPLAGGLDIRLATEVAAIARDGAGWSVMTGDDLASYDTVILAIPAPQAVRMLAAEADIARDMAPVRIAPCWALMLAFDTPTGWPDLTRDKDGPLALIARNSAKPGRGAVPETWVVHASPQWSREILEQDRDAVLALTLERLRDRMGGYPAPVHAAAHRWRFAQTETPLGRTHLASADGTLLVGGDWALGARVEAAYDSGAAMARALLAHLDAA